MPSYFAFLVLVPPFLLIFLVLVFIPQVKTKMPPKKFIAAVILSGMLLSASIFVSYSAMHSLDEAKNSVFKGVIEKAYYEEPKKIPHITINGIEYDLGSLNYSDYDTIKAGDSAVKNKGTLRFKLIKRSNK